MNKKRLCPHCAGVFYTPRTSDDPQSASHAALPFCSAVCQQAEQARSADNKTQDAAIALNRKTATPPTHGGLLL